MGKILVPFDPVTMRWLNESTDDISYKNQSSTFESGYDDPTYLTFRIEFGGWGASTIPSIDTFKLMQRINTNASDNLQKNQMTLFRYDDYPQGLLDLNFADTSIKLYPGYAFNNQVAYNAVNYLLQRNEDTRAEYLKLFVEGLYEVQRKYPYIFQKISGISNLSAVSPEKGLIVNQDASIKVECLEGLQQKMTTLMTLYKKAAWDSQFQRWILPENYRQFKMIVYLFERRTFHSVSDLGKALSILTSENTLNQKQSSNFGQQMLNWLTAAGHTGTATAGKQRVSGQAPSLGPSAINPLLPIHAFECDMCEFDISNIYEWDSLEANWDDTTQLVTGIIIKVGKVRHYFKNGLTKKLKNTLVYDLISVLERNGKRPSDSDASVTRYISKERLYENEQSPSIRYGFGGGGNAASIASSKSEWDSLIKSWKQVFGKKMDGNDIGNVVAPTSTVDALMQLGKIETGDYDDPYIPSEWSTIKDPYNIGYWRRILTFGGSTYLRKQGFWGALEEIFAKTRMTWRLDKKTATGNSDTLNLQTMFAAYDWDIEKELTYYSYATQAVYAAPPNKGHSDKGMNVINSGNYYANNENSDRTKRLEDELNNLIIHGNDGYDRGYESEATRKDKKLLKETLVEQERNLYHSLVSADDDGRYEFISEAVDNPEVLEYDEELDGRILDEPNMQEGILEDERTISEDIDKTRMEDRTVSKKISDPKLANPRTVKNKINSEKFDSERKLGDQSFASMEKPRAHTELNPENELIEEIYTPVEIEAYTEPEQRDVPEMEFEDPDDVVRELPEFLYEDDEEEDEYYDDEYYDIDEEFVNTMEFVDDTLREIPDYRMEHGLDDVRMIPNTELETVLPDVRIIPDQRHEHGLDEVRELQKTSLETVLPDERIIPDQRHEHVLDKVREIPESELETVLDDTRSIDDMSLTTVLPDTRAIDSTNLETVLPDVRSIEQDELESVLEDVRSIPLHDMETVLPDVRNVSDMEMTTVLPDVREINNMGMTTVLPDERIIPTLEMPTDYLDKRVIPDMAIDDLRYKDIDKRRTGIIFETMEGGRKLEIIDVSYDPLDERKLPNNQIIIDRDELLDIVSKSAALEPSKSFIDENARLLEDERKLLNLILDEDVDEAFETLGRMSAVENRELLKVLDEYSMNSDDIRAEQEQRIKTMQALLKQASLEAIRMIPLLAIIEAEKNPKDLSKDFIIVPDKFVDRIKDNYILYSVDDAAIRDMSMQNLMTMDKALALSLVDTSAMTEAAEESIGISKATSEQNMEMVTILNSNKKSSTGKTLLG